MRIGRISITGVRGIRHQFSLDTKGQSLLVRGDNGTGKSSIVQAMRWALTDKPMGASSTDFPEEYLRHRLEPKPEEVKVRLELLPKGQVDLVAGKVTCDLEGEGFRDACIRANPFLRRDEVLAVLQAAPGERFKYLESFLDLDHVDGLCTALNAHLKQKADHIKDLTRERDVAVGRVTLGLPAEMAKPTSAAAAVTSFSEWARNLGLELVENATWEMLVGLCSRESARAHSREESGRRARLAQALEQAAELVPPDHPSTVLDPLREAENRARDAALMPLLQQALHMMENNDRDACPVCEQAIVAEEVVAQLRQRVAELASVNDFTVAAQRLAEDWTTFLEELDRLERQASCSEEAARPARTGRELLQHLNSTMGPTLSTEMLARLELVRSELARQLSVVPDEQQSAQRRALCVAVATATNHLNALREAEVALEAETSSSERLRCVLKAVSAARKNVAVEVLDSIGTLVAKYYGAIHPPGAADEPTGAPQIELRQHTSSPTARVRGMFDDQKVEDPRLLYSDGHLDTIGICMFLALRRSRADRERANDPKLMVLDDIITSVDMGHARRLTELIRDEFADHQLMIFSHNELFIQRCQKLDNAVRMDLLGCSLESGPRLAAHISHLDDLVHQLETTGAATKLASAMRIVADEFVDAAAHAFQVSLPAGKRLTLGDYWPAVRKKLGKVGRDFGLGDLRPLFAALDDLHFLRNAVGAHHNEPALDVELSEVQSTAKALLALIERLRCTRCGSVVRPRLHEDPSAGLRCDCAKKETPALKMERQIPPCSGVVGT